MSRHPRSGSRARAPSPGIAEPDPSIDLLAYVYVDRSWVDPRCMLRRLVDIGALLEGAVALGSSVPSHSPPVDTAQSISEGLEMLIQCSLAQPAPVVVPQPIPTATPASATASSGSGKPSLKLPDPSVFEGDPMKLDPWLMQTEMFLGTYDVGLSSARSVEVATTFFRCFQLHLELRKHFYKSNTT
eukprot:jgi/Botrbrau1/11011/Bobra.101_1s0009.1